tara:strand:- start:641 stop:1279 length:639 start_codon:yes stop_codon:yes gene_type:complete
MFRSEYFDKIYRDKPYKEENEFLIKFLNKGNVLDIGGGTGTRATLLQEQGFKCLNIDPDEKAVNISRRRGVNSVKSIIENPKLKIQGDRQIMDNAIMMFCVFNFLEDHKEAFRNIGWFLKGRGRFIFDFWNYDERKSGLLIKLDGKLTRISYKKWNGDVAKIRFWFPFKRFYEEHELKIYPQREIEQSLAKHFDIIEIHRSKFETIIISEKK